MVRFWHGCLAIACFSLASPAGAGFMDGNSLLERCQGDQSDFRKGYCAAYVAGVADSIPVMPEVSKAVCIPATATLAQLRDVTVHFLEQHPETRHVEASAIVLRALVVAFPC